MTDYFLDASAAVKRYADEAGSAWIGQITDPLAQNTILLAEITLAEVAAALAAKQRAPKGISLEQRNRVLSRFLQDCEDHFALLSVDRSVIDRAVELTQRHRLRAYDAVQLPRLWKPARSCRPKPCRSLPSWPLTTTSWLRLLRSASQSRIL